jgi:hypothetical protein
MIPTKLDDSTNGIFHSSPQAKSNSEITVDP